MVACSELRLHLRLFPVQRGLLLVFQRRKRKVCMVRSAAETHHHPACSESGDGPGGWRLRGTMEVRVRAGSHHNRGSVVALNKSLFVSLAPALFLSNRCRVTSFPLCL